MVLPAKVLLWLPKAQIYQLVFLELLRIQLYSCQIILEKNFYNKFKVVIKIIL